MLKSQIREKGSITGVVPDQGYVLLQISSGEERELLRIRELLKRVALFVIVEIQNAEQDTRENFEKE